jgi:hypothetical protein
VDSKNRPCECGSGLKWKHCCGNLKYKVNVGGEKSFRERILEIPALGDIKMFQDHLTDMPSVLKNQEFCMGLSVCLGANGYVPLAIELTKKLLKKRRNHKLLLLNLAVMYGQLGDCEKQHETLAQIPSSYLRTQTAYASILSSLDRDEEAISVLENICRSGRGFYLTFLNLASYYPLDSEQRQYWLELGVKRFPRSPDLRYLLAADAIKKLEFELANNFEVDSLDFTQQPSVIHSAAERSDLNNRLIALKRMAQFLQDGDVDSLVQLKRTLPELPELGGCEVTRPIIELAVKKGRPEVAVSLQEELCSECKKTYDSAEVEISAYMSLGDVDAAKDAYSRRSFDIRKDGTNIRLNYASFLDDAGLPAEAIKVLADNHFFVDEDKTARLRAAYDGFFYATQIGNHILANKLISEACKLAPEDLLQSYDELSDGVKSAPSGYWDVFLNWRELNLVYSFVALREVDDADSHLRNYLGERIEKEEGSGFLDKSSLSEYLSASAEDVVKEVGDLISWARDHRGAEDYHNQLFTYTKNNMKSFSHIAGKLVPSVGSGNFSLAEFLFSNDGALGKFQHSGAQAAILQSQGDISHIVNSLREQVPGFSALEKSSRGSLVEAEARFLSSDVKYDPSATVHGYCKALEIHVKKAIFGAFKLHIQAHKDLSVLIEQAKSDKKAGQFSALLRFFSTDFIELGGMLKSMELARGKTADRVELVSELKKFIAARYPRLLDAGFQENLQLLATNFRNPSAHDSKLPPGAIEQARSLTLGLLAELTTLRVVGRAVER